MAGFLGLHGGLLCIVFIAIGACVSRHAGVLIFAVTSLLGNLGATVVLDVASPPSPAASGASARSASC